MAKRTNYLAGERVADETFRAGELRQIEVPAELVSRIYKLPDNMSPAKMAAELNCPADYVKAALLQGAGQGVDGKAVAHHRRRDKMPKKRKECGAEGCPNGYYAHGYCQKHYVQVKIHGRLTPESEHKADSVCTEVDKPAEVVKVEPVGLPHMTVKQLVCSTTEVFWRWNRANPIGWPRAEKSRLY